jgi:hypothetical protein
MIDRLPGVHDIDITGPDHVDLLTPADLHDDGTARRVFSFEGRRRSGRQQPRHHPDGDAVSCVPREFRVNNCTVGQPKRG